MLSVCLIFLYLLVSTYIAGFLILSAVGHVFGKPEGGYWLTARPDGCVMAGLVFMTVYAQFFSLFYKVGLLANALFLIICIPAGAVFRRPVSCAKHTMD